MFIVEYGRLLYVCLVEVCLCEEDIFLVVCEIQGLECMEQICFVIFEKNGKILIIFDCGD